MIDRRRLLVAAAAVGAAPVLDACAMLRGGLSAAQPAADPAANAAADALVRRIGDETVQSIPELATNLGLDGGGLKAKLTERSAAARAANIAQNSERLRAFSAIDRHALSGDSKVAYESVRYQVEAIDGARGFAYGDIAFVDANTYSIQPYTLSQLTGVYQPTPDFLDTQHAIETAADAEAYLSRLSALAVVMDQETGRVAVDAARGVVPPDFILTTTIGQMRALRAPAAAEAGLTRSLARRTAEKQIAGDWAARATRIVEHDIYPALERQIALLTSFQGRATHDAGVWRLPDGDAYYAACLKLQTTTDLSADDIHGLGVDQSRAILDRMDGILRRQGMTQGTVGRRMSALGKDARYHYPNTEAGKAQLLHDLNDQIVAMRARLPQYFGRLPRAGVEVRRVPPAIEAGAPGGYAIPGNLDGSRGGAYYINLRDTAEWPKWSLPTLTYHEAIPGHLLQGPIAVENTTLPLTSKFLFFSAYGEGWALYSEQLADEMGVYADDPLGELGFLQSQLFRASRLVVDTGMHAKRWSREQAIQYFVDTQGDDPSSATTEIERYCVWPGQACSYKVGHTEWVRLREDARRRLGTRFDIRGFHDVVLQSGTMPIAVLQGVVADWVAAQG